MFKKSIRKNFLLKLLIGSASLIFGFSSILYFSIEKSIYYEKHQNLLLYAKNIANNRNLSDTMRTDKRQNLSIEVVNLQKPLLDIDLYEHSKNSKTFITLIYPFNIDNKSYLKITQEISPIKRLLNKILNYIFIINIFGFGVVILYAIGLSKMLIYPVEILNSKLSNMNEHLIKPIKVEELPLEFETLGFTLNHLISRIQNFVKYQKELFIGTAHELKTPLAVIKLKNQVILLRERSTEEYIEALQATNKTVDEMNDIVSSILNVGRQEGALLEKSVEVDVIEVLQSKADDFRLLAESANKRLEFDFTPNGFMATLQITLLNQILQNFLQNALKFTPENRAIMIRSSQDEVGLLIEVIDEGCGIDESIDLFAPFKRVGERGGVGLGLFLAKSASDALGANIKIRNRGDGVSGTISSLQLNSKLSCILPQIE